MSLLEPSQFVGFSALTQNHVEKVLLASLSESTALEVGLLWLQVLRSIFPTARGHNVAQNHDFDWPIIEVYEIKNDLETLNQTMSLRFCVHCFTQQLPENEISQNVTFTSLKKKEVEGGSSIEDRARRGYVRDPKILSYCASGARYGRSFTVVTAEGGEVSFRRMDERDGKLEWKNNAFRMTLMDEDGRAQVDDYLEAIARRDFVSKYL